ncbi:hypothetical protein STHAL_33520 [Streptomyces halstedii]|uniref:Secreted protein/lipoprotein n=1 Tax=Streptomyces halstedii TaxID=1944 RepID=A0ABS6U1R9_STRHA|nr:hypothetical protein [Streptomyces halstedii]MBV7674366.1 hypothetical protein [Streptomyces halstedii]
MHGRLGGAAGAVVLVVLLAGCGGEPAPDAKAVPEASAEPSASASASASADPQAAEEQAVLAAYRGMWREQMAAYRKASVKGTRLKEYAALNALSRIELDVRRMKEAGTVATGDLGHDPAVAALDLEAKGGPTARITDCLDLADWAEERDGKPLPLPSSQPTRYRATAEAQRWEGRWRITEYTPEGSRTC